jgi:nitroreductase
MELHPQINKNMSILKAMRNRYATKKFNAEKNISEEDLETIFEAINLSPTSYGLQLFKVFHVKDEATRKALQPTAWNQSQITDASDLLVFAARTTFDESDVDSYMDLMAEVRSIDPEKIKGYGDFMKTKLAEKGEKGFQEWTSRQPYIALGNAMTIAASLGIDSCPMEGFEPEKTAKVLNMEGSGFAPVVLLALGYRSQEDATQHAAKVRKPLEKLIETV